MSKLTELFRAEYNRMVRFIRRQIDDTAARDAEDVVQDVMLTLFDHADVLEPIENLSAYIYQALRNKVVDLYRRRKKLETLTETVRDVQRDTQREFEQEELLDFIFLALDFLDKESRAVLIATELEGYTFQELSEKWEIPLGTLLARKSRALKKLREKLIGLV